MLHPSESFRGFGNSGQCEDVDGLRNSSSGGRTLKRIGASSHDWRAFMCVVEQAALVLSRSHDTGIGGQVILDTYYIRSLVAQNYVSNESKPRRRKEFQKSEESIYHRAEAPDGICTRIISYVCDRRRR